MNNMKVPTETHGVCIASVSTSAWLSEVMWFNHVAIISLVREHRVSTAFSKVRTLFLVGAGHSSEIIPVQIIGEEG